MQKTTTQGQLPLTNHIRAYLVLIICIFTFKKSHGAIAYFTRFEIHI